MEEKWFTRILIIAAVVAIAVLVFATIAYAAPTVCQIGNGCTGTSTTPAYGQIPIGGQNGEYEFVASSTLGSSGGGGGSGFSTTSAAYWLTQQTTSGLAEGSNLYFTNARAVTALTGQNISLFTNNVGYLTSLAGAASSTLLTDNNTFAGLDLFTDALSNFAGTWQGFSPSHFLTGNQTMTLSGAISGSGATSITAEFASTTPVQFGGTGSTTLSGILKGNGTGGVLTAIGDTDYQKPISLTTSGSSGAASFSGDVLNIPQYSGITYTGMYPITVSGSSISIVSTSTFGCTVSCFASPNISQWTNNSGYVTSSFSTTSAAYWQSVNNFFSTTSASYFLSLNQGAAFSTTSANYWQTQTTFTGASTTLLANNNTFSGNDTFNNTISGSVSGNAGTATVLQTARTINGVSFNGSANIVVASTTLLSSDNNTFSGNTIFAASSTFTKVVNLQNASSSLNTFGTVWLPSQSSGCATFGTGGLLSSTGSACGTSGGITALGNYATTSGTTISLSTSTETTNGVTQGIDIVVSANGILFTPTTSGTLSNAGLAHSTIVVNSQTLTLGDSNDTITAASSSALGDNDTFSGTVTFNNTIHGSINGNANTATSLAANGTNCAAGYFTVGVDASGNSEGCTYAVSTTTPWSANQFVVTNSSGIEYSAASSSLDLPSSALQATGVSAGSYTNTNLTVNAEGQITAASNGSGGSGGISWPWTTLTNWATSTDATTTAYTAPAYFASSTLASQFPYASSTAVTITGQEWVANFESVLFADQYSGSDIGAKINAAYAALPSTGGTIAVPSGAYTFSTPINFGTSGKLATLQCSSASGGTTLTYNGNAASSTIVNDFSGGEVVHGFGIKNCSFAASNTASTTSGGIFLGGSNGAAGVVLDSVSVTGFGDGLVTGANTYEVNINNTTLDYNYTDLLAQTANNSGEQMSFTNDSFLDGENASTSNCVILSTSAYASAQFSGSAIDDCNFVDKDGNYIVNFTNDHFENPNQIAVGRYDFIDYATVNNGYSQLNVSGSAFVNDATTTAKSPNQFILSGGVVNLQSDSASSNSVSVPAFVGNVNTGFQELDAQNMYNINSSGYSTIATSSTLFTVDPRNNFVGMSTSTDYNSAVLNIQGTTNLDGSLEMDDPAAIGSYATLSFNGTTGFSSTWPWTISTSATTPIVYGGTNTNSTLTLKGTSNGSPSGANVLINPSGGGNVEIATTTPSWGALTIGTSTAPQLALSDNVPGDNSWIFRNTGGNLFMATSSVTASSTFADPLSGYIEFPSNGGCIGCFNMSFPGGIDLRNAKYVSATSTTIAANTFTTLYTVPAGRRALVITDSVYNTTAGTVHFQDFANISGSNYLLNATTAATTKTIGLATVGFVLNAGESLNTLEDTANLRHKLSIIEYDASVPMYSARALNPTGSFATTTLYTVPTGESAFIWPQTGGVPSGSNQVNNATAAANGTSASTVWWIYLPNGQTTADTNTNALNINGPNSVTSNGLQTFTIGTNTLNSGDQIQYALSAAMPTGSMLWVNVYEH